MYKAKQNNAMTTNPAGARHAAAHALARPLKFGSDGPCSPRRQHSQRGPGIHGDAGLGGLTAASLRAASRQSRPGRPPQSWAGVGARRPAFARVRVRWPRDRSAWLFARRRAAVGASPPPAPARPPPAGRACPLPD
eukprot:scaffold1849_cov107-Isochrysis_galbana.AAC.2